MFFSTVLRSDSANAKVLTTPGPNHFTNSLSQFFTSEQGQITMTRLAVRALLAVMPVWSNVQMRVTDWRVYCVLQSFSTIHKYKRDIGVMRWICMGQSIILLHTHHNEPTFPNPISSAKMHPAPSKSFNPMTHSYTNWTPSLWCGRNHLARTGGTNTDSLAYIARGAVR